MRDDRPAPWLHKPRRDKLVDRDAEEKCSDEPAAKADSKARPSEAGREVPLSI
jgi:hypothetical protein